MKLAIVDTSCLILFAKLGRLTLLQQTFSQLATTTEVIREFGPIPDWIETRSDRDEELFGKLNNSLGLGESSCIALAMGKDDILIIIDDRQARTAAERLNIECMGSLGVLLIAKNRGVIKEVSPILTEVQATDFWVSDRIISEVRRLAKES